MNSTSTAMNVKIEREGDSEMNVLAFDIPIIENENK